MDPLFWTVCKDPSERQSSEATESARQALAFMSALVEADLTDCVVSPGSRSTPLVLALQHFPQVKVRVILDERSAAFFALGIADRTGKPVALVCTSGTAGANYFPAVIEASERGVPLLVLTADRPPELRDCGAGQTIDQIDLFGKFVRWSTDAIVSSGERGEDELVGLAYEGYRNAVSGATGPVHFNLPFREPFLPGVSEFVSRATSYVSPEGSAVRTHDWAALRRAGPGWIIVGASNPLNSEKWADSLFRLSDYLGWPIFADVLNPLRQAPGAEERVVTQYEGLLAAGAVERDPDLRPSAILQVGIQPTAKSLRLWLAKFEGPRWQWTPTADGLDPAKRPFTWIEGSPLDLGDLPEGFSGEKYRGNWLQKEMDAVAAVTEWMNLQPDNFEGKIHYQVAQAVPREAQIFVANSMPVRDAERFWFADRPRGPRVFSNRGASGIDGLVSMVAGLADGGPPTVAVLGDLAFLHDSGGLRAAGQVNGSLTYVVIDNGGGRIFGQLPVRSETNVFERYFLTPQSVDLVGLCQAHGIEVRNLSSAESLKDVLGTPWQGVRVIIVQTDPEADDVRRREWRELFRGLNPTDR